jgi:hypothetical protein
MIERVGQGTTGFLNVKHLQQQYFDSAVCTEARTNHMLF